jgi:hypothetical protein
LPVVGQSKSFEKGNPTKHDTYPFSKGITSDKNYPRGLDAHINNFALLTTVTNESN